MDNEGTVTIPLHTAICAARHFVAAHESACTGQPVDWGGVCVGCSELQRCLPGLAAFGWLDVMSPILSEVGIYPEIHRADIPRWCRQ